MSDPNISVRRPRLSELRKLRALFVQATHQHFGYFPESYRSQIIAENRLRHLARASLNPRRPIFVAKDHRRLLGYIITGLDKGEGHVYWLFVDPAARGKNVGVKLLSSAMDQMKRQGANHVVLDTHDHQEYYRRQGFVASKDWIFEGVPITTMEFKFGRRTRGKS